MTDEYMDFLGYFEGRPYFLTVRATPSLNRPREFAAIPHYQDPDTDSEVEVARIDTAHGHVHFDKLYRRDQPKEPLNADLWDAIGRLENNWRRYAERYSSSR